MSGPKELLKDFKQSAGLPVSAVSYDKEDVRNYILGLEQERNQLRQIIAEAIKELAVKSTTQELYQLGLGGSGGLALLRRQRIERALQVLRRAG